MDAGIDSVSLEAPSRFVDRENLVKVGDVAGKGRALQLKGDSEKR